VKLETMYQEIILDHYKNPHGKGLREPYEAEVHHVNPTCGDEVTVRVHLEKVGSNASDWVVADLSYDALGCSISQAATSVLHDLVVGKPVEEARGIVADYRTMLRSRGESTPDEEVLGDAVAFAGVSRHANRVKCAILGWTAFEDALLRIEAARPTVKEA
jgi:nitrogen fixation protein NifU and related proteins